MNLQPNSLLQGGKYKIEKVLGQGGFGVTYQAIQSGLNRKVAIKEFFMKDYCNRDEATSQVSVGSEGSRELVERFRSKFMKEAQMIADFKHPNIIRIFDIFEENGTAYYVMEYIGNGSLKDRVEGSGLSEKEAVGYVVQIAHALDYIHQKKIAHLDVKPSNILVDDEQTAVLIDFGISKHYDDAGSQTTTSPVGRSKGFAPLEQYQQGGVTEFSACTDIYSLGATLYFLLTGKTPPEASEVYEDGLPELPASISEGTRMAVKKAMQPRRKERLQSIKEFLELLAENTATKNSQPTQKTTELHSTQIDDEATRIISKNIVPVDNRKNTHGKYGVIGIVLVFVSLGIIIYSLSSNKKQTQQEQNLNLTEANQSSKEQSLLTENNIKSDVPELIDMGVSVLWAKWNYGAKSEYDYGKNMYWGVVSDNSEPLSNIKDFPDNIQNTQYDIFDIKYGKGWKLPSRKDFSELCEKCDI